MQVRCDDNPIVWIAMTLDSLFGASHSGPVDGLRQWRVAHGFLSLNAQG